MALQLKIKQANQILTKALNQYKPSTVIMLSSWGHDSQVSTDIAYHWSSQYEQLYNRIISLDTGVSADGWLKWIHKQAAGRYENFEVRRNKDVGFNWYIDDALEYGFQYTKAGHTNFYYRMLKERTIRQIARRYKQHANDHIMFVSGVYRAESVSRQNVPEIEKRGLSVWVNPCVYWQASDFLQYRMFNDLPNNPFYETVGGSGDCQCNWGQFTDLETLQKYSPCLYKKIMKHNGEIVAKHGYGWGEKPSNGLLQERAGQLVLPTIEPLHTPNLCAGCQRVKPKHTDAINEVMIREVVW